MLTALDQVANRCHLQMIKAAVPYLPTGRQKTISVLIKMLELKNVLRFYSADRGSVQACSLSAASPQSPLDILSDIRTYCEEDDQALIDQCMQMFGMLELYSTLAQTESLEGGPGREETGCSETK